jgi:hypothetical protein
MSDPHGPQATQERLDALQRRIEMLEALVLKLSSSPAPPVLRQEARYATPQAVPGEDPDPAWIPIRHEMIRPAPFPMPCGNVGLYLTEPPQEHKPADLSLMRVRTPFDPAWKVPQPGIDEPRCSSCWQLVDPFSSADLNYLAVMVPPNSGPRARRKSGDVGRSADQRGSPDPAVVAGIPAPSTYPGHTTNATFDITSDIKILQKLAKDAGLQ